MKIAAETALGAWAVFTAWLVLFLLLEKIDKPGPDWTDWTQGISAVAALALFPFFRRGFAAWLAKYRS